MKSNPWEIIPDPSGVRCDRLKVPGGWIVRTMRSYEGSAVHQIFIKDEGHTWKLEDN